MGYVQVCPGALKDQFLEIPYIHALNGQVVKESALRVGGGGSIHGRVLTVTEKSLL